MSPADRPPQSPEGLAEHCFKALKRPDEEAWNAPVTNPVGDLAHALFTGLRRGSVSIDALEGTIGHLADHGLAARAEALRALHQGGLDGSVEKALKARLDEIAAGGFEAYEAAVTRRKAGVVFTAHPTFALSRALRAAIADAAIADKTDTLVGGGHDHGPDRDISLPAEHEEALEAINRAKDALGALNLIAVETAREHFPDRWRELEPDLISIATWVGYDLDGRADIHWGRTIAFRLEEKAIQLRRYAWGVAAVARDAHSQPLADLARRLKAAAECSGEEAALFGGDLENPDIAVEAANRLTAPDDRRIIRLAESVDALTAAISRTEDDDIARRLVLLRAEMKAVGLGAAHIHLRINAAQLRSAVRADLGLEGDDDDFGRLALVRASERAAKADVRKVSFASVFLEQMTARRQFMMCAQFLKHVDAETPIRFLLAECETPATVMGAVYLARLYGVADVVDISPLFETPDALERGGRLMDRLLDEPVYRDYVAARGRLAIQLGFSDAGRFMGQVAAELAIERLHILVARAMAKRAMRNVDVVIFNTHGESMGRGAHPGSLTDRLDHLLTPWTRAKFAAEGLHVVHESSYQGGDGFLHFAAPELARAVMLATASHALAPVSVDQADPFYAEIDFTWDVYRSLKEWQENLFKDRDYRASITAFAPQMLVKTGSRKAKRPGPPGQTLELSMLRAIPHNAALQQLAIPVNVSAGVGSSIGSEPDRMRALLAASPRMTAIRRMVERARTLTSLDAFRGYARLYDASEWTARAFTARSPVASRAFLDLAGMLADQSRYIALDRLANLLSADLMRLDRLLETGPGERRADPERRSLDALHAIRQALVMHAFVVAARLPAFSRRHDLSREDILELVLALRIPEAVEALDEIFPAAHPGLKALEAVTEDTGQSEPALRGYPEIQASIVRPLEAVQPLIQRITVAITHHYRAFG